MTHEEIKSWLKKEITDNADILAETCIECLKESKGYDKFFKKLEDLGESLCDNAEWANNNIYDD